MNYYYYKYWVTFISEIDDEIDHAQGVTVGESIADALDNIVSYYGDHIEDVQIVYTDENCCFECEFKREGKND